MVSDDDVCFDSPLKERIKDCPLGPIKRPVINNFARIKAIPKVNNGINSMFIQSWKEGVSIKCFKVLVEYLISFLDTEMCIADQTDFIAGCLSIGFHT